jgi:hypothetical protein
VQLLAGVEPDGAKLAAALRSLLDVKDTAQYGVVHLTHASAKAAIRGAKTLVEAGRSRLK